MSINPWIPVGYVLPGGTRVLSTLYADVNWQIAETEGHGRVLLATPVLADRWIAGGIIQSDLMGLIPFGDQSYRFLVSGPNAALAPVENCGSPRNKTDALAFALALRGTRAVDPDSSLQDAIYVETISRLLPIFNISQQLGDDIVLGRWLTGGAHVSTKSTRRLCALLSWMQPAQVNSVIAAAGLRMNEWQTSNETITHSNDLEASPQLEGTSLFTLAGRPEVESFINEHVIDIIRNRERYEALGIGFPSAIVLHGPPGCGKTFAVEKLVQFLAWPSFQIDASSVASPYIHETSRKVAEVFDKAIENAPSVLVIDEMEAFLADRSMSGSSSQYHVEEMAEFLRRIPEATKRQVLIIAMTNRIDMIDPAILRRGRFDHIIKMDYANENEARSLLENLVSAIPNDGKIDFGLLAKILANRPLSDVNFVVREGARLAARGGRTKLDAESLMAALNSAPSRVEEERPKIGFQVR
jgi:hypothetical protein